MSHAISILVAVVLTACSFSPSGSGSDDDDVVDAPLSDGGSDAAVDAGIDGMSTDASIDAMTLPANGVVIRLGEPINIRAGDPTSVYLDTGADVISCTLSATPGISGWNGDTLPTNQSFEVVMPPTPGPNYFLSADCLDSNFQTLPLVSQRVPAESFTLTGPQLVAPGRYRLPNRSTAVTWVWNLPGEQPGLTCSASSSPPGIGFDFSGAFECSGSLGPRLAVAANGPAVTISYTFTGPLFGYRGTVQLEVPASQ